jgi:phosphate transport system substrate-binding protein
VRKLFVSYARENKPDVDQLVEHLRTMGYDTWVDVALRGGQDWWDEILDRIAATDAVIAIYSSAAMDSTACAREFEWATALGKPVIPVAVEPPPTALPSRFARRQIVDYSQPEQRPLAALRLQGALATLPPTGPLPDPLPEPPAAPLSYLTDLIDLITQSNVLDHDQQYQILRQLEHAFTSVDPLERRGGRDILERFSRRSDLYADVDRAITRLRQLSDQPAPVGSETRTHNTPSTAQQLDMRPDEAAADLADQSTQGDGKTIGPATAGPESSPTSTTEPQLGHYGRTRRTGDVAEYLAEGSAPGAEADTQRTGEYTPVAGSDTNAAMLSTHEPALVSKPITRSDQPPRGVDAGQPLFQRLSRRTKILGGAAAALVVVIVAFIAIVASQSGSVNTPSSSPSSSGSPASEGSSASQVVCGGKRVLKASGSTAQANAMTRFVKAFEQACPDQTLNYTANGSGAGISEFTGNQTDFGGSDSPLAQNESAAAHQRCGSPAWNLPVVFGPIAITYNVGGVSSLNLDGPTAAKIFNGAITTWNDPAIAKLNAGTTLPAEPIHVVFRTDQSGTTDNFQHYLDAASDGAWGKGTGKTFNGGVGEGARGNDGTSAAIKATEGSITYNEWSFARAQNLTMANIITSAGPDAVAISADSVGNTIAGATIQGQGNDLVIDTTTFYKPTQRGSYPIVLATYEIVCSKYPDSQVGTAVKAFLQAAIGPGQNGLAADGYIPIPAAFETRLSTAVNAIA